MENIRCLIVSIWMKKLTIRAKCSSSAVSCVFLIFNCMIFAVNLQLVEIVTKVSAVWGITELVGLVIVSV